MTEMLANSHSALCWAFEDFSTGFLSREIMNRFQLYLVGPTKEIIVIIAAVELLLFNPIVCIIASRFLEYINVIVYYIRMCHYSRLFLFSPQ